MATAKKKPTKKTNKKTVRQPRSFVVSKEMTPFLTWKATHQTAYWLIICLLVLAIGTWAMTLTVQIQDLYNQVESVNTSM